MRHDKVGAHLYYSIFKSLGFETPDKRYIHTYAHTYIHTHT